LIDGREDNFVARDMDDDAASGEIGDDFVAAVTILCLRDLRRDYGRKENHEQGEEYLSRLQGGAHLPGNWALLESYHKQRWVGFLRSGAQTEGDLEKHS